MAVGFSTRYFRYQPVVPTTVFNVPFPIFGTDDLTVITNGIATTEFSLTAKFVDGVATGASITLVTPVSTGYVDILGDRDPARQEAYSATEEAAVLKIQRELDRLVAGMQEMARNSRGALRTVAEQTYIEPAEGDLFVFEGGKFVPKAITSIGDLGVNIAAAEAAAVAAQAGQMGQTAPAALANIDATDLPTQFFSTNAQTSGTFPTQQMFGHGWISRISLNDATMFFINVVDQQLFWRQYRNPQLQGGGWQPWRNGWDTENTTVDTNGFIKEASPIVRLSSAGVSEPVQPINATFQRVSAGVYRLSNVNDLAQSGWQIEVPQDHNGNRLVFVGTSYDGLARVLTVTTSTVVWDPLNSQWDAGVPMDIPAGRWVDIRLQPNVS